MKKILLLFSTIPFLISCGENVESIISEVYGSKVLGFPKDGRLSFKLDYSKFTPTKRDADLNKFKKKLVSQLTLMKKDMVHFIYGNLPTLKISLADNRSLVKKNTYLPYQCHW